MKKVCIIVLLFGLYHSAFSQTITIKDQKTKEPIELVALISESPRAQAETNEKGKADISAFQGAKEIIIRRLGYETEVKSYVELESLSFELFLQPKPFHRYDIVVSATRWRQTSRDVPTEIVTIPNVEVALQNPQTAADLLELSGKVFIQKSQMGGGSPMIRGFATNRLLYTVDGVRMNTAIFRGGNIQNIISLDPYATESTEVFFGPGSVIYGSDAIGGVMSFQTLTPQFSISDKKPLIAGNAEARHSSANNEMTGHFDVNIGWEKWALVTSFSSFDYSHLRQGSHGPDDYLKPYYVQRQDGVDRIIAQDDPQLQIPSGYTQKNFMQKVRFSPTETWDLKFGFHYSETSSYGRYDRHNRIRNGLPRYAEWDYGPQKWIMNNLTITHDGSRAFYDEMTVRLALQSFEESRISRSLNSSEKNIRIEEVEAYSANFDFVKSTGYHNTLYYGMEYVMDEVNSTGLDKDISTVLPYCQHCGTTTPGPSRYPQSTWQSLAAYVNNQYKFSDRFLVQAGLRYNQYSLDAEFDTTFYPFFFSEAHLNNGALTGTIGGVYRPSESWVLSTNFSTAFRSPNVDDVGKVFDSEPGSVVVPNPDLEAEYAYNVDLGMAKIFGDFMRIDMAGYYTSLQNAMVRRDFLLNGQEYIVYDGVLSRVQAIQNAAVSNVYGFQAGIEVKLPAGFSFSSDFNYQRGEEELDDGTVSPSRHAAPWFGTSRITYDNDRLTLQFYAAYQGERKHEDMPEEEKGKYEIYAADAQGNTYSPGWITLNIKAKYQITDYLKLSAGIENLSDQRYRPYSSGISQPCRNFILSLGTDF
ncbi:MAG: TonB-dependent receptor plug domain-containing protein [Acidobacteriota bacterium]